MVAITLFLLLKQQQSVENKERFRKHKEKEDFLSHLSTNKKWYANTYFLDIGPLRHFLCAYHPHTLAQLAHSEFILNFLLAK